MKEGLGRRVYREYCWFAVLLLAVLLGAVNRFAFDDGSQNHRLGAPALTSSGNR